MTQLSHCMIHDLCRYGAVCRELSANQRQHSSRSMNDLVLSRSLRGELLVAIQEQGTEPGPGRPHILDTQPGTGETGIDRSEQIHDIVAGDPEVLRWLHRVGISSTYIGEVSPWEYEHDPTID